MNLHMRSALRNALIRGNSAQEPSPFMYVGDMLYLRHDEIQVTRGRGDQVTVTLRFRGEIVDERTAPLGICDTLAIRGVEGRQEVSLTDN